MNKSDNENEGRQLVFDESSIRVGDLKDEKHQDKSSHEFPQEHPQAPHKTFFIRDRLRQSSIIQNFPHHQCQNSAAHLRGKINIEKLLPIFVLFSQDVWERNRQVDIGSTQPRTYCHSHESASNSHHIQMFLWFEADHSIHEDEHGQHFEEKYLQEWRSIDAAVPDMLKGFQDWLLEGR